MYHGFHKNIKHQNGFELFDNNKECFISTISEGSCDTEDWSNDAENSALHHRNKLHFNIY